MINSAKPRSAASRSIQFQPIGAFAPDHFAYDMTRIMFLPWTFMQSASRQIAAAAQPDR